MNVLPKKTLSVILCAGIAATVCTVAFAATLTAIDYNPKPVIVGYPTVYQAKTDNTNSVDSYRWEYDCLGTPCEGGTWAEGFSNTDSWNVFESHVGTYSVRCTAKFQATSDPDNPNPPPNSEKTITITVPPPDNESLEPGSTGVEMPLNNTDPASRLMVKFKWSSGSQIIGPYIDGYVQEFITHISPLTLQPFPVGHPDYKNGPWEGPFNQTYIFQDGYTVDGKAVAMDPPNDDQFPVGFTYRLFDQTNRLYITDCCGVYQTYEGTKRRFRMFKSSPGNWALEKL